MLNPFPSWKRDPIDFPEISSVFYHFRILEIFRIFRIFFREEILSEPRVYGQKVLHAVICVIALFLKQGKDQHNLHHSSTYTAH